MERYGKTTRETLVPKAQSAFDMWEMAEIEDPLKDIEADLRPKNVVRPETVWKQLSEAPITKNNAAHVVYASKVVNDA